MAEQPKSSKRLEQTVDPDTPGQKEKTKSIAKKIGDITQSDDAVGRNMAQLSKPVETGENLLIQKGSNAFRY